MALYEKRVKARTLRLQGLSYSEIKDSLKVSKSTLSVWLKEMPLTNEKINELRAHSPRRIERFRKTMTKKREARVKEASIKATHDFGTLTKREIFIAGLFLYWGEGGKTNPYAITLSNTDPGMIRFYMMWLRNLEIPHEKIRIRLHLYSDMDIEKEILFWSKTTHAKKQQFMKPSIKKSLHPELSERGFGHGTCNVIVRGRDVTEYTIQLIKYMQSAF